MRISPLSVSNTVGIVAPARKVDEKELLKGCEIIESWGLKIQFGKHCFDRGNKYLAASDADRLEDLQLMLNSAKIDTIFCARGGYGTTRILDHLNWDSFIRNPKWIVGFSDITALHLKLHQLGIESIHACMPIQFFKSEYEESVRSLKKILFTEDQTSISAKLNSYNRHGKAIGAVIGGNLSLVVDSLGTSTEPNTKSKILVLEEIDERLYKVDRMFMQLKRAGKLSDLAGLVIGHMTDMSDTELPFNQSIEELIMDKTSAYSYPVAFNFPIGHEAPNLAWRHAAQAELSVSENKSELIFE